MDKEQIAASLGRPADDFRPIEDYLEALATERRLPRFALGMCTLRIEEAAPVLRAVLVKAADHNRLSEAEERLLFRGIHVLGAARDTQSCAALLRLVRRPFEELDLLLGDAVTENLPRILCGVFDGNTEALFALITDPLADEFAREAGFGAAAFHTWSGSIPAELMRDFLERFYAERLGGDAGQAWIGWADTIARLSFDRLAPLVRAAWDEGLIIPGYMSRSDFENDLAEAKRAPGDVTRFKRANLGYIEDVLETLEWTDSQDEEAGSGLLPVDWAMPQLPASNPLRGVGRNDPCPCGSGKKAKHCCLKS